MGCTLRLNLVLRRNKFEVKLYYKVLALPIDCPFPWKSIWRVKDLLKSGFLCVDNGVAKDFDIGLSEEVEYNFVGMLLCYNVSPQL